MRIVYPYGGTDAWVMYLIIVVIQTVAIWFGMIGGEKIAQLAEQRRVAIGELKKVIDENGALQARLVEQARESAVDEERQRMAREIHDTIAQGLTGVITQLEAAGQARGDTIEMQKRIDNAMHLARDSLAEARRSMRDMVPAPLAERGLVEALEEVTVRWSSLNHVPAELTTTGTSRRLHPEVEVTVLRVTQEALANVAKHAGASRVGVTLSYMGDIVSIDVRDDGVGLDPAVAANGNGSGFGLTAMRQRIENLSGTLEVESEPGAGTAISASLPAITVDADNG
jgi:signal transduction histidine kinase